MLCYCDKCGNMTDWLDPENHECFCCGNFPLKPVPTEYIDDIYKFCWRDEDRREAFIEEVIKKSPNLDPYLFEHREEIIKMKNDNMMAAIEKGRAIEEERNRKAKCPICGSSNVSKIGVLSRAVSVGLFGLASSAIGKTHKCNNCGTTW